VVGQWVGSSELEQALVGIELVGHVAAAGPLAPGRWSGFAIELVDSEGQVSYLS